MSFPHTNNPKLDNTTNAIVVSTTRRFLEILLEDKNVVLAKTEAKAKDVTVGDSVNFAKIGSEYIVSKVLPRKNCLERCYRKVSKKLTANVDLLIIVAAVNPLFNTPFIDRISVAATSQHIKYVLVINKSDLGLEDTQNFIDIYKQLNIPIIITSVKDNIGINEIRSLLDDPTNKIVTLSGISGVGKSSLLNNLIPSAARKTSVVSNRSGQGKQTTSQACAYSYARTGNQDLLLVDLPGLSSFGLSHMTREEARNNFPEFSAAKQLCQYADCFHLKEPNCAVKIALENASISQSRYQSYIDILNEIEEAREY